jgi:uncharacterized Ntn-hydrolase superfamily protein
VTYSIVGRDRAHGQVGAAVQSAWFGSAGAVILVEAGIGAIVTQAMGERKLAHQGLTMLATGLPPADVVAAVTAGAAMPSACQIGAIALSSTPAALTGVDCVPEAGHHAGADCVAQGNMMHDARVPEAMVAAFEAPSVDLAGRLLAALDAAQDLGGDFRGMQSAGLVVRPADPSTPPWDASVVDVRIDDHAQPLRELRRIVELATAYRSMHMPLVALAAGDREGALHAAQRLFEAAPTDPNVRMRLGLAMIAAGEAEGRRIMAGLAARDEKWMVYARQSLLRFGIEPEPFVVDTDL